MFYLTNCQAYIILQTLNLSLNLYPYQWTHIMQVKPSCSFYVPSETSANKRSASLATLVCLTGLLFCTPGLAQSHDPLVSAQESFDHPVKYAIYSAAWHLSSNAGLRIVAQNQSDDPIELKKVVFRDELGDDENTELELNLLIPPQGWAETQIPYQNILTGNDCVERTMQDDWRLVEISNYTLNPSVRGLIIENTRSFRIYQCVRRVNTLWVDHVTMTEKTVNQWLMYHFERLPLD
jgi:hypothetical protein